MNLEQMRSLLAMGIICGYVILVIAVLIGFGIKKKGSKTMSMTMDERKTLLGMGVAGGLVVFFLAVIIGYWPDFVQSYDNWNVGVAGHHGQTNAAATAHNQQVSPANTRTMPTWLTILLGIVEALMILAAITAAAVTTVKMHLRRPGGPNYKG